VKHGCHELNHFVEEWKAGCFPGEGAGVRPEVKSRTPHDAGKQKTLASWSRASS
jgi:hypothetical protein